MRNYLAKRALLSLSVLLGAMVLTFLILHLVPGDPAQLMLADVGATPAQVAALREQLGLNDSLAVQLGRFLWRSLHFDFGHSLYSQRPVIEELARQLPATAELALAAFVLASLFGVPLGIVAFGILRWLVRRQTRIRYERSFQAAAAGSAAPATGGDGESDEESKK